LLGRRLKKGVELNANCRILLIIFAVTIVGGFLNSGRWAGGRNHYFSSYLVAAIFIFEFLVFSWVKDDRHQKKLAQFVCLCIYSIGLLLSSLYLILPNKFGKVFLLTSSQRESHKKMISEIKAAAKPAFVEPNYLALPWNSGQDYPDIVDDTTYIFSGITIAEERIKNKYYAEAFLTRESRWRHLFEESGYKETERLADLVRLKAGNTP